uniref:Uncharacterized protein n=1 Tax=Knipowitschia caucasica TaxID=637954 RepID=A0AAV2J3E6_KNICA
MAKVKDKLCVWLHGWIVPGPYPGAGPARGGAGQHCSGGAEVKFSPQLRALQSAAAVPSPCHRSRSSCIMFLAKGILGGLVKIISNIDPADFVPSDPPPPRRPLNAESHENEEEKRFRRTFEKLAGDDMEICPMELKNILDDVCRKSGVAIGEGGFSIETCRSMVAVMDVSFTQNPLSVVSGAPQPERPEVGLQLTFQALSGGAAVTHRAELLDRPVPSGAGPRTTEALTAHAHTLRLRLHEPCYCCSIV